MGASASTSYFDQVIDFCAGFNEDCARGRFANALQALRFHCIAEQSSRSLWRASAYDTGLLYSGHQAAERCAQRGLFDRCYLIVKELRGLLNCSDRRRAAFGEDPLGNTETRLDLTRAVADCLAHDPRGELPSGTTAGACIRDYRHLLPRWLDGIKRGYHQRAPEKNRNMYDKAAWTGLAVIKAAYRYACAEWLDLLQDFNREFGATLMAQPGYVLKNPPPSGRLLFHYDFEFYKLSLMQAVSAAVLRRCHEARMKALDGDGGAGIDEGLRRCFEREFADALRQLRLANTEVRNA